LKLQLQLLEARGPDEIDSAFVVMIKEGAGAVSSSWTRCSSISEHALLTRGERRLPSVYGLIDFVEAVASCSMGQTMLTGFGAQRISLTGS